MTQIRKSDEEVASQAYLWDRATGERVAIDRSANSYWFRSSDDGQAVALQHNNMIYRWDRASGVSTALTRETTYSVTPMISSDGNLVVFPSQQLDLTGAPMPAQTSLALYDAETGSTSWIAPAGGPYPRMNPDASVIVTTYWPGHDIGILRRVE